MNVVRRLALLAGFAAALSLSACTGSGSGSAEPRATGSFAAATTTPATAPAVQCDNATASFAPSSGSLDITPSSYMARIRRRGHLVAAVSADTLLFGFRNPFSGRLEGFDIDLVRAVAKEIFGDPNKISYKVVTYGQRIPALQSGDADIVADVMTINCKRWTQIDFTSEYFRAGQRFLVRSDSRARTVADLNFKRVCVATGSTNFDKMKDYPKVITVPVDDISDCMVLFQQGTVDSVTGDDTVLAGFVAQDPYAKIIGSAITTEPYGLGIAQSHPDFVRYVNAILQNMRDDGTWARMYRKWLHPTGAVPAPPLAVYGRTQ